MKTWITLLMLTLTAVSPAAAQQLFDYLGQADVPASVGGTLTAHGVIRDASPATTPIPLDFANYEYTLVVSGLVLDGDEFTQTYSGGTVTIYADQATAADHADPSTFTDGTAVLVGDLLTLSRTMFTATLGTANGFIDWTGGSELGQLAPADRLNWAFLTGINTGFAEAGYDEQWDGKVEPQDPIVATEAVTWGALKARMR